MSNIATNVLWLVEVAFKQASSFVLKTTIPRSQNIKLNNKPAIATNYCYS